uniref:Uncharacterized protein n=1 Tax=Rhizophora mucronata TaxID=61149 RepID=A0A2P2J3G0_RHIMU
MPHSYVNLPAKLHWTNDWLPCLSAESIQCQEWLQRSSCFLGMPYDLLNMYATAESRSNY